MVVLMVTNEILIYNDMYIWFFKSRITNDLIKNMLHQQEKKTIRSTNKLRHDNDTINVLLFFIF